MSRAAGKSTLGTVISTLEELTGEPVSPADLLAAVTMPGPDREARAWLDRDASRLGEFEPYDWGGADPSTLGEPVRVGPAGEFICSQGRVPAPGETQKPYVPPLFCM